VSDRIVFPGSPWPAGHGIEEMAWTGRLEPTGLWFDLHLVSASYYAEDADDQHEDHQDDGDPRGWTSRIVWANYHSCKLSSTKWGHSGFLVGTEQEPLTMAGLASQEFLVDSVPEHPDAAGTNEPDYDEYDHAFGIYVLGHDSVAGHRIRFPRQHSINAFSLDWRGRIALTYTNLDAPFEHGFHATVDCVRFERIDIAASLDHADVRALLSRVLIEADEFVLTEVDDRLQFVCHDGP
jgi:hypothetical protein